MSEKGREDALIVGEGAENEDCRRDEESEFQFSRNSAVEQ